MDDLTPVLTMTDVSIAKYDRTILSNVDMSLHLGEFCYLMGRTGSGKTTLLEAIYGGATVSGQEALVLGHDLCAMRRETLPFYRRKLGMIFQEMLLLEHLSVRENYDYVLRATGWTDESRRVVRIDEVLEQIKATEIADTPVAALSGGMQKITSIGRAILNSPRLILADEPTGHLDEESAALVMKVLMDTAESHGSTVLLSTHDTALYDRYPARRYNCVDGSVMSD